MEDKQRFKANRRSGAELEMRKRSYMKITTLSTIGAKYVIPISDSREIFMRLLVLLKKSVSWRATKPLYLSQDLRLRTSRCCALL